MKKEPNSIASLTLGIIKVFSSSRAQSANATKRSGVQFFPFTSDFNCATTGWRKAKNRSGIFIVISIEKNCYTVFHSKPLFLIIEKAERINARLILLFAVQIDFYAEIFVRKEIYAL